MAAPTLNALRSMTTHASKPFFIRMPCRTDGFCLTKNPGRFYASRDFYFLTAVLLLSRLGILPVCLSSGSLVLRHIFFAAFFLFHRCHFCIVFLYGKAKSKAKQAKSCKYPQYKVKLLHNRFTSPEHYTCKSGANQGFYFYQQGVCFPSCFPWAGFVRPEAAPFPGLS